MPIALRLLRYGYGPSITLGDSPASLGFTQTLSSPMFIATETVLGRWPDISLQGVLYPLTLSGHVSLQTSTEYGQVCRLSVSTSLTWGK